MLCFNVQFIGNEKRTVSGVVIIDVEMKAKKSVVYNNSGRSIRSFFCI